jgi:hypothetical protein
VASHAVEHMPGHVGEVLYPLCAIRQIAVRPYICTSARLNNPGKPLRLLKILILLILA